MTNINVSEIKKSLARLAHYEKIADDCMEAYEKEPMNEDREESMERAYELEFNEFVFLSTMLSKFAGIDEKIARTMIKTQRDKLIEMFAQIP